MKLIRKEEGSVVIEATLMLPFVILLLILLTSFIRISIVEMELANAGSETVKMIAHHVYPAIIAYNEIGQEIEGKSALNIFMDNNDNQSETVKWFRQLNNIPAAKDYPQSTVLNNIFQPILDANTNEKIIDLRFYQLVNVRLPAVLGGTGDNFGFQVRYDVPLKIPFVNRSISIIKNFEERIWYDQTNVAGVEIEKEVADDNNEEETEYFLKIHSISSPVQRGHNVKIIIEATPNKSVNIRLTYNSGFVKEVKGEISNKGTLAKEIIIGGHSNEGEYVATVFLEELSESITFHVLSKDNMDIYIKNRISKTVK